MLLSTVAEYCWRYSLTITYYTRDLNSSSKCLVRNCDLLAFNGKKIFSNAE